MLCLLARLAENGFIANREKFRQLGKQAGKRGRGLWEFKSRQVSMIGDFRTGRRFLITHGLIKKGGCLRPSDIDKAIRILGEFDRPQPKEVIH